jgi:hypothetical protein
MPSIKQIAGPARLRVDQGLNNKNIDKDKTHSKSKKKGKVEDHINDYFLQRRG